MWEQSKTLFVTLNIPGGSNNDADNWFGLRAHAGADGRDRPADAGRPRLARTRPSPRRSADGVGSVVILEQADMWDLDGKTPSHIANYKPFIDSIATHTLAFGKPVLLVQRRLAHVPLGQPAGAGSAVRDRDGRARHLDPGRVLTTRTPTRRQTAARTTCRTSTASSSTGVPPTRPNHWSTPVSPTTRVPTTRRRARASGRSAGNASSRSLRSSPSDGRLARRPSGGLALDATAVEWRNSAAQRPRHSDRCPLAVLPSRYRVGDRYRSSSSGQSAPTASLLRCPSRSAVDNPPGSRSNREPEVGSCFVGPNGKRRAHPVAGS